MPPRISVAEELPPLPPTSIDFDALQQALREGKPGEEAIELAIETVEIVNVEPEPDPEAEPESPADPEPTPEPALQPFGNPE